MNESQLRKIIAQQLREELSDDLSKTLVEYYDDYGDSSSGSKNVLYKIFVSPMTNVLKATKLASQDILNSFKLVFTTLVSLSPKKLVKAREEYNATKKSLNSEWAPLMKRVGEVFESTDFNVVTFSMAPNIFFGYHLAKFAASDAPATVSDFFERVGFDIPLKKWFDDIDDTTIENTPRRGSGSSGSGSRASSGDESPGILDRLRIFFLGESSLNDHELMLEAEDNKNSNQSGLNKKNIAPEIQKYFEKTGFDKTLDKLADDVINSKQAHANKLLEASREQVAILKSFASANSLEEFDSALDRAKSKGAEVDKIRQKIDALKADLQKKADEMKNDKSFKQKLQKSLKDKKISDDDVNSEVEKAMLAVSKNAINQIKNSVKDSLQQSFTEIKNQIREELSSDLPTKDSPVYTSFSNSKNGQKLLAIIDKAVNSLGPTSE